MVNGDSAATFTGGLGTTATSSSGVDSYAIGEGTLAATGNYTIGTFNGASLTVNPAALTVTAASPTTTFGAAVPALTYTYTGLVNGDSAATFTGGLSTTATSSSTVGDYPITEGTLAATGNYTIGTFNAGSLTVNQATPKLSLSAPNGVYNGSPFPASVTIAGTGNEATPAASLESVSPVLTYYVGSGTSGTDLGSTPPVQPGTYTVVAVFPGSTDYTATPPQSATFTIAVTTTNITLGLSSGSAVFGQPVTLDAGVSFGAATPGGSITFYDGSTALGTVPINSAGHASLTTSALAVGGHAITAAYSGDSDLLSGTSGAMTETVSKAATRVVLVPQPVFKKKHKLVSLGLKAEVEPIAPGAGVPSGTVTFEIQKKVRKKVTEKMIGTMSLSGGAATLSVKPKSVLKKPITIVYGGDASFTTSTSPVSKLTPALLKSLARPMIALYGRGEAR